ncbi:MAG: DUF424 family protein [Thermoplasmatales archaeon]|nr:DUF424 family protein [Thermoplasmatales archaeon]
MISVKVYCKLRNRKSFRGDFTLKSDVAEFSKGEDVLVAACDSELLGKKFSEGELCLEVSSFYDGKKVSEKTFLEHMANATSANLVGEKTVDAATKAGFISKENVIMIQGVPYAVMVRV